MADRTEADWDALYLLWCLRMEERRSVSALAPNNVREFELQDFYNSLDSATSCSPGTAFDESLKLVGLRHYDFEEIKKAHYRIRRKQPWSSPNDIRSEHPVLDL